MLTSCYYYKVIYKDYVNVYNDRKFKELKLNSNGNKDVLRTVLHYQKLKINFVAFFCYTRKEKPLSSITLNHFVFIPSMSLRFPLLSQL